MNTHLTQEEIASFKSRLEQEKAELEKDLAEVGHKNPEVSGEWEAVSTDLDESIKADKNEVADKIEEYEGNTALVSQFETELTLVKAALERIEKGTYGICTVSGEEIEKDRLNASPSAATCKACMNSKV